MNISKESHPSLRKKLEAMSKVDEATGCIEWQGYTHNGYGKLSIGSRKDKSKKTVRAHRLSFAVYVSAIPEGIYVCHKCDNRKCINPNHLFLGTHQDNIDDRQAKGRNVPPVIRQGEEHQSAKLKWADVKIIRSSPDKKDGELASMFGVSRETISGIRNYRWWKATPPVKESE